MTPSSPDQPPAQSGGEAFAVPTPPRPGTYRYRCLAKRGRIFKPDWGDHEDVFVSLTQTDEGTLVRREGRTNNQGFESWRVNTHLWLEDQVLAVGAERGSAEGSPSSANFEPRPVVWRWPLRPGDVYEQEFRGFGRTRQQIEVLGPETVSDATDRAWDTWHLRMEELPVRGGSRIVSDTWFCPELGLDVKIVDSWAIRIPLLRSRGGLTFLFESFSPDEASTEQGRTARL